jgi:hypothetical protein
MPIRPNASFLNAALETAKSPANLMGMLTDHYLQLDTEARDIFVMSLIGQVAAQEAVRMSSTPA